MHKSREPSQEYLRERFDYDAERGVLVWKHNPKAPKKWNSRYPGTLAGGVGGKGYAEVMVDGVAYRHHRILWVCVNGAIPDGLVVDHLNGDRLDNRISNLRVVSNGPNIANARSRTSRPKGVKLERNNRVSARITIDGKEKRLGNFKTLADAGLAYELAYELHYGIEPRL